MNHTPGPWKWQNQSNGSANLFAEDGARLILANARLINKEANARLITSSPDLLQATQRLVAAYNGTSIPEVDLALEEAEKAIQKATQ